MQELKQRNIEFGIKESILLGVEQQTESISCQSYNDRVIENPNKPTPTFDSQPLVRY